MKFYLVTVAGAALIIASAVMLAPAHAGELETAQLTLSKGTIENVIGATTGYCKTSLPPDPSDKALCQERALGRFVGELGRAAKVTGDPRDIDAVKTCSLRRPTTNLEILRCIQERVDPSREGYATE